MPTQGLSANLPKVFLSKQAAGQAFSDCSLARIWPLWVDRSPKSAHRHVPRQTPIIRIQNLYRRSP
ncbi:hypothetical protein A7K73_01490 [Candidatus Methylacidiphilum fumarolicum]|nr:hypothetical protein A7K73_01490 [Candidatus Methylacidiphilum fumarolicum]TFE77282.1 hypothetical protein A7D33_05605 [Candidatus Methylacidiphilum fumarolicum]